LKNMTCYNLDSVLSNIEKKSGGILGVSAIHLPSLERISYNSTIPFLLCSTCKIPIAVCLLKKVEENKLKLTDKVPITEFDLRVGCAMSTLNQLDYTVPVQMSILNLLTFMLQESCNSATDMLFKLVGGPKTVTECMHSIGIDQLRVDRTAFEAIGDSEGVRADPHCTIEEYKKLASKVPPEKVRQSREQFKTDPRDKGTAEAMTDLLVKIQLREILSEEHSSLLLKVMSHCKRGIKRIKGLLPSNINVAHKTGTAGGYTNDVGIIDLLEEQNHIAISIFLRDTGNTLTNDERIIER
jgi:beta-lactamase class A